MNLNSFYFELYRRLDEFSAKHTAGFEMDFEEWMETFCVFAVPEISGFEYVGDNDGQ